MLETINFAIANRCVVEINYDGALRMVEPHALGRTAKGDIILRGFQTGGESDTLNFGWKLFKLEKIEACRLAPPRAQYNPVDSAMKGGVIAALGLA